MSDQVVIAVPKPLFHRFLGKLVLVVIVGGIVGYFITQSQYKELDQVEKMTPVEKKAYFEQANQDYENNLKNAGPTWAFIPVMVIVFCLVFGLYELLGLGLSRIFRKIFPYPKSSSP
jgi:uncharacterized BrkB/YihY/UPF0761 family membrane protein